MPDTDLVILDMLISLHVHRLLVVEQEKGFAIDHGKGCDDVRHVLGVDVLRQILFQILFVVRRFSLDTHAGAVYAARSG